MRTIKIAPSILAVDFADLRKEIRNVLEAGEAYIHVDMMDGHFVPNISICKRVLLGKNPGLIVNGCDFRLLEQAYLSYIKTEES